MKRYLKHITYSLSILAMMTSCQEEVVNPYLLPDKYIVFGKPGINLDATIGNFTDTRSTRATLVESVDKFRVWGYCVPNNISGGANSSAAADEWKDKSKFFTGTNDGGADLNYLANREVDTSSASNYNNGDLCEWNNTDDALHSFIALAPGNASYSMEKSSSATAGGHGPRLTITLDRNATAPITTSLERTEQPDILLAAKFDHAKTDGPVTLSFMHIMTALRFKFHNHSERDLIIKKMTFSGNFHRRAVIDFTNDKQPKVTVPDASDVAANSYAGVFSIIDDTPGSWQTITHGSEDYAGGDTPAVLMLLPNPDGTTDSQGHFVLGTNKSIDITYRFADDPEGQPDRTFSTEDNFVLNYLPEANTLHTAHFNFIGDKFVITFQADDNKNWENGSDNDFTIN